MTTSVSEKKMKKSSCDLIPIDIIPEILKASDVKTLARFICLSKEYASIIRNHEFIKSYLIKSSTRPQGLFLTFESGQQRNHFFFSTSHGESSSVATYHMKCNSEPYTTFAPSVHGLIIYGHPSKFKVYNPSTRRSITLPNIDSTRIDMYRFLGYNPIDGVYKVLCMTRGGPPRGLPQEVRVLTLGNDNSWRIIEDFPPHTPQTPQNPDICIDGVLYYETSLDVKSSYYLKEYQAVMSFDVRSENFRLIRIPSTTRFTKMTSYKGKLARIAYGDRIDLLVLEDAAKHEWSSMSFDYPSVDAATLRTHSVFHVFCATDAGEFVLAPVVLGKHEPFCVLYYDPEKKSVRRVDIEGLTDVKLPIWDNKGLDSRHILRSVFSRQVENLMFL